MAEPLKPYEIETLLRSAAMAPLARETVARVLEAHRELLKRQADLEAMVARLRPAWAELRASDGRVGEATRGLPALLSDARRP